MKMITNVNEVKLTEEEYDVFIGLLYEDRTTLDKIIGFVTDPDNNDKPAKRTYLPVDSETKEMFLSLVKTTFESNIFLLKEWISVNCRTKVKMEGYVSTYVSYEKFVYNDGASVDELDISEIDWNMDDITDVEAILDPDPSFSNEEILELSFHDYTEYLESLESVSA